MRGRGRGSDGREWYRGAGHKSVAAKVSGDADQCQERIGQFEYIVQIGHTRHTGVQILQELQPVTAHLLPLEALPSQNSTQVKNKWGDVVRQVHDQGVVAITHHSSVELVVLSAGTYQSVLDTLAELRSREQAELDALAEQFRARLAVLQQPQSHDRLARVLASKGRARKAPKAGKGF
jgi:PHD/YefM family antitoxin component YafN of YafNO toxin-antitoxin module